MNVGRESLQLLPQQIEIVEDGEVLVRVAELAERGQNVRLGFPIFGLQLRAQVLVERRRPDGVEKREDFEFLFHGLFCAFELAGKQIIHDQRRDESGDPKVLLWIIVQHMKLELIAAVDEPRQEFVDPEFLLVCPLAD